MASSKISDLTAVVTPATGDEFAVNQSGTTKKVNWQQLIDALDADIISFTSATGTIAATSIGGAIREIEDELIALDADTIPFSSTTGGIVATNVGDALRELQDEILDITNVLIIDNLNNRLGVNVSPDGTFHAQTASSGATAHPNADDGIFEGGATAGISLLSTTNSWIYFGDAGSSLIGRIGYDHTADKMQFFTNNGERAVISSGGLFTINGTASIGTTSSSGRLHVDQNGTAGAQPVLYLDQADVSEEFIRFVGTAAAATLTQSIVAEADVTTATRQGFLKTYVQDDGNQITDQDYFVAIYTLA